MVVIIIPFYGWENWFSERPGGHATKFQHWYFPQEYLTQSTKES